MLAGLQTNCEAQVNHPRIFSGARAINITFEARCFAHAALLIIAGGRVFVKTVSTFLRRYFLKVVLAGGPDGIDSWILVAWLSSQANPGGPIPMCAYLRQPSGV